MIFTLMKLRGFLKFPLSSKKTNLLNFSHFIPAHSVNLVLRLSSLTSHRPFFIYNLAAVSVLVVEPGISATVATIFSATLSIPLAINHNRTDSSVFPPGLLLYTGTVDLRSTLGPAEHYNGFQLSASRGKHPICHKSRCAIHPVLIACH